MGLLSTLVSYWKLDTASGNATDVVSGNTLINTGTATYSAGKINNGVDFGATNSTKYLSINNKIVEAANGISISFWVKMNTEIGSGTQTFVYECEDTDYTTAIVSYEYNGGTRRLKFERGYIGDVSDYGLYNVNLGTTWHHIVYVFDADSASIYGYLDGTLVVGPTVASSSGSYDPDFPAMFRLGADNGGGGTPSVYASVMIDEVGVWSTPITSTDVTALYNSGNGIQWPFDSNSVADKLVLAYTFEDSSCPDLSGTGNTATTITNIDFTGAGIIDNCGLGTNISDDNIQFPATGFPTSNNTWSLSLWANKRWPPNADNDTNLFPYVLFAYGSATTLKRFGIAHRNTGSYYISIVDNGAAGAFTEYFNYKIPDFSAYEDRFHHYVLTYDGTTCTLYLDGTSVASKDIAFNFTATPTIARVFKWAGAKQFYLGKIDELYFMNRCLNQEAITGLYNNGAGVTMPLGIPHFRSRSDSLINGASRVDAVSREGSSFARSIADLILNSASRFVSLIGLKSYARNISDSIMNSVSRLDVLYSLKVQLRLLSEYIMNGASRVDSVSREGSAFIRGIVDSMMIGASRIDAVSRVISYIRSISESLMNASSRLTTIDSIRVIIRSISESIMNGAPRLSTLTRVAVFTRYLNDSIMNAVSRLVSQIIRVFGLSNPKVSIGNTGTIIKTSKIDNVYLKVNSGNTVDIKTSQITNKVTTVKNSVPNFNVGIGQNMIIRASTPTTSSMKSSSEKKTDVKADRITNTLKIIKDSLPKVKTK